MKAALLAVTFLAFAGTAFAGPHGFDLPVPSDDQVNGVATSDLPDFDLDKAKSLVWLAYAAFCPPEDIAQWNCTWCGMNKEDHFVGYFNSTEKQGHEFGFVTYRPADKEIRVVFRGSHGFMSWFFNFKAEHVAYPNCEGCKVHDGFFEGYIAVRDQVVSLVSKAKAECKGCNKMYITGHSLGGALSTLCAVDMVHVVGVGMPVSLYTYGGPRVGNKEFMEFTEKTLGKNGIFRVTHHRDPVPHLPPSVLGLYYHPPTEIFNNAEDDTYTTCDRTNGEDKTCAGQYVLFEPLDHALYLGYNILSKVDGKEPCESVRFAPPPQESVGMAQWAKDHTTGRFAPAPGSVPEIVI